MIVFAQDSTINKQNLDQLAKMAILRDLASVSENGELLDIDIELRLKQAKEIIFEDQVKYDYKVFFQNDTYTVLSLSYSPTIQLHTHHLSFWLIERNNTYTVNHPFEREDFVDILNQFLLPESTITIEEAIWLTTEIMYTYKNPSCYFFSQENREEFEYISDEYKIGSREYNRLSKESLPSGINYNYQTFMKENIGNTIFYYHVLFSFKGQKANVETKLLYKVRV